MICATCHKFRPEPDQAYAYAGPMCRCWTQVGGITPLPRTRVVIPVDEQRVREIIREELARAQEEPKP